MRNKTSVADMDSCEAQFTEHLENIQKKTERLASHWRKRRERKNASQFGHPGEKPPLTLGNIIHFIIAVFFLWPVFLVIAAIWSLGDAVNFLRHSIEACISSTFWFGRLCREWTGSMYLHKNSPGMLRLRGQRRAFGVEAAKDWRDAGKALLGVGRAWSKTFGLGGLFNSLEKRIDKANVDWRRYVATAAYDASEAPAEFPEQYVVVDELPPGGSSARLYIVRKTEESENGQLYVLKYFNLRAGGNLESVIRESQAAQLAQKMGLIIESKLGDAAFWYVMPYYHGETLTGGVLRNIKQARENDGLAGHYRISLGYVHQLLQIIAQYHEAGVFHKDIKPDNLIINGERIYLVDIGLMTPLSSMSQLTTHGTEYFRDPEMVKLALEGREVREVDAAKFDVYSIGAVLFFALSGEFPTSGALSRLPREVPMATQWVVNRAMTGMHQRYSDARAMLTDVDYLSWAAAQGQLDSVKPADLPSFKGMPVPAHLQPQAPVANTEYRERLAASPGGYGAWYSAPAYAPAKKGLTFGRVALILFLVGGLAAIGLATVGTMGAWVQKAKQSNAKPAPDEALAARLPGEAVTLRPVFDDIDYALNRGVHTDSVKYRDPISRVDLVPTLVKGVDDISREWETSILADLRRHDMNKPGAVFGQRKIAFLSVDPDAADAAMASGIELEFELEAARQQLPLTTYTTSDNEKIRSTVASISDKLALHRELAARFADAGDVPAFIVVFTIEHEDGTDHINVRAIYPGREYRAAVPFGEKPAVGPAPEDEPGLTRGD
ncbi:MAG: hypothetical protein KDB90_01295 [Planctomycetes bacterium]|nr:hypothetical protein [Planctomycetota bacterium]